MIDHVGHQFGRYRLSRFLGHGAFASTYLGEHIVDKTLATIKIFRVPLAQDEFNLLVQEIAGLRIDHPSFVPILGHGVENNLPFLVAEYVPGSSLRQCIPGTIQTSADFLASIKATAQALHILHEQQRVHGNVKPENILIGANTQARLSDLALPLLQQRYARHPQAKQGLITYMAPEQIRGQMCKESDQYSLGLTIYEYLGGKVVSTGTHEEIAHAHEHLTPPSLHTLYPALSRELDQVVMTALSKDPQQRFRNIQAFVNALEQTWPERAAARAPATPPLHASSFTNPRMSSIQSSGIPQTPTEIRTPQPMPTSLPELAAQTTMQTTPPPSANFMASLTPSATPPPFPAYTPPNVQARPQQAYYPPAAPQRILVQRISPLLKIALACLSLLFLAVVGLSYFAFFYQPNQLRSQAPIGQSSATSQTRPAGNIIQTPQATRTAADYQALYTKVTSGTPVLNEPLNAPSNYGWEHDQYSDNGKSIGSCNFTGGAYHSKAEQNYFIHCIALATNYSNFAYQVEMTIVSGHSGGLVIRADGNASGYYFRLSTDSTYILSRITLDSNGTPSNPTTLLSGKSLSVRTGTNQTNLLGIVAQGSDIHLYVNKQYITSYSDSTFTSGRVGVFSDSDADSVEAVFRNAEVWRI